MDPIEARATGNSSSQSNLRKRIGHDVGRKGSLITTIFVDGEIPAIWPFSSVTTSMRSSGGGSRSSPKNVAGAVCPADRFLLAMESLTTPIVAVNSPTRNHSVFIGFDCSDPVSNGVPVR
jgi:hypothetical protein